MQSQHHLHKGLAIIAVSNLQLFCCFHGETCEVFNPLVNASDIPQWVILRTQPTTAEDSGEAEFELNSCHDFSVRKRTNNFRVCLTNIRTRS